MMSRTLGEKIPLSIGTAIPFEEKISVVDSNKHVDGILFNVRTLWRNYYGSYEIDNPSVREILPGFIEEIAAVRTQCNAAQISSGFYNPDYRKIRSYIPRAIIKEYTEKQKHYYASEQKVSELLKVNANKLGLFPINIKLPVVNQRIWMMTHAPIDLLNRYNFTDLKLIDSHTGNIKGPADWMSKITNNPDYVRIPFNVLSLTIFGDGHYIKGYPLRYRKALKEIAESNHWTPLTTAEKIIYNLKNYHDKEMAKEMIAMFNITIE